MSSNSGDGILSPKVRTEPQTRRVNDMIQIGHTGGPGNLREHLWMDQYGGKRNLFDALGYVNDPDYRHYRSRYERTDAAQALVNKIPQKAWDQPEIIDLGADEERSDFEQEVNAFLSGEYTEDDPIQVFERATKMERLGHFAILFLGLNDSVVSNVEEGEGVDSLDNEVDEESLAELSTEESINFLKPYDEGKVDWDEIDWYTDDPTHERFAKPKEYEVEFGDMLPSARVHHSRVVHIAGEIFENEYRSPSTLKQSINTIDDIEKIRGGSAEGYWRSAYMPLIVSPPEINGQLTEFSDDGEGLSKQIDRYINNFSREIFTQADFKTINTDAENPMPFLRAQWADLAIGHDIPQSILMGNETGERATQEDRAAFHERAAEFRRDYCYPVVLRRFIDQAIKLNIFPEPEGGMGGWRPRWPAFQEKTEMDEANEATQWSNAISTGATAISGGPNAEPEPVMSVGEYRQKILGWNPEVGSEVDNERSESQISDDRVQEAVEEMEKILPDTERVNEILRERLNQGIDLERVRELIDREDLSSDEAEELRVKTSDDFRGVIVDVLTKGFTKEGHDVVASDQNPKIVVVTESEDKPFGFYEPDEVSQESWSSGIEDPTSDLEEAEDEEGEEDRENSFVGGVKRAVLRAVGRTQQEGHFTWPRSWRKSEKPARLIALDAWISMGARHGGGSAGGCTSTMRGKIASPDRFCADFKDRLYQWDYWRGDSWAPGD